MIFFKKKKKRWGFFFTLFINLFIDNYILVEFLG